MHDKHDAGWLCFDAPGPTAGADTRKVHIRADQVAKVITDTKAGAKPGDEPTCCYVELRAADGSVLFQSHETTDPKCQKMAGIMEELATSGISEIHAKKAHAKKESEKK